MFLAPGFPYVFVIAALVERLGGSVELDGVELHTASRYDMKVCPVPGFDRVTLTVC